MQYRRAFVPGGTYFFTLVAKDRSSTILIDHIDLLREVMREEMQRRPLRILASCILPDHIHMIWQLPENDADYPKRWRRIKSDFCRRVRRELNDPNLPVWQQRYWEHCIRDEEDLQRHVDYIHFNPVKHGWAQTAQDWPLSSFHRWVQEGKLPSNWASNMPLLDYDN